jgi:hypothetical protein
MEDKAPMALVLGTLPYLIAFINSSSWDVGEYCG